MCALDALSAIIPTLSKEVVSEMIVPTLVKACDDRVPNVQFCVARIIKANRGSFDSGMFSEKLEPKLREMSTNSDKDVAYFATMAMK